MADETQAQLPLEPSREDRLEQVLAEYLRQVEQGVPVDHQAVFAAHPDLADDLREFFGNQMRMQRLVGAAAAPTGNGIVPTKLRYFGDYEILEEIAHGGMGVVYKARQTSLNRIVAVKMILAGQLANESDVKRFQAEAEAAANLHHPGIVGIYEVGINAGQHYYSMEYIAGQNLAQLLREKPLPISTAAQYVRDIATILEYAHDQKVLHRDLKPSNILLDASGRLRITDFGLAKRVEGKSDLTITGQVLGTPSYMSPEQAAAQHAIIGPPTDIYALGAILYELVTGRPPFRSESIGEILRQVQHDEPVRPRLLNPKLPRDLETICLKCLEKEPRKRYVSARSLADDLDRFLRGEPILARPISRPARIWRWCRRKPVVAGLSAVSALAIALTIAVLVFSREIVAAALADRTTALGKLEIEQRKTLNALGQRTVALEEKTDALNRLSVEERRVREALSGKSDALKRERITAYANTLTLARREWLAGNLARTLELLNTCHPDLRHWEWHYLRRLCEPTSLYTASSAAGLSGGNRMPVTLEGETLLVNHGASNAAEELVATNSSTGAVTPRFRLPGENLGQIAVSGNGHTLLSGTSKMMDLFHNSAIELRDAQSGKSLFKAELPDFSLGTIAVNADGTMWAAAGSVWQHGAKSTGEQEVRVWKKDAPPTVVTKGFRTLVFSPDGMRFLTGHSTGFELWETAEFAKIAADGLTASFSGRSLQGVIPCFRRDSSQFAYAAGEFIAVFDSATGQKVRIFHLNQPEVSAVGFGDGDRKLAYGTAHGNVVLLDLQTGKEDVLLRLPQAINQLEFSPDGSRLITLNGQGHLQIWDTNASPESDVISGHAGHSYTAAFDRTGALVATVGEHNEVRVWDVATKTLKYEIPPFKRAIYDVAFSANGKKLATAGDEGIQVWNLETGAAVYRFTTVDGAPMGFGDRVEFARQGNWLVGGHEHGATIWDISTGKEVRSFGVGKGSDWLSSVRLSADGSRLATCGHIGDLQLWDTANGREIFKVEEVDTLYTLAFSPDEKQIIACGLDKDILIVDATTGAEVRRLSGHATGANTVAFSGDGNRLVSTGRDGVIKIWDAETGLELLSFQGNATTCYSATFSPDDRRLVTTEIGLLRIWDAGVSPADPKVRREMAAAHNARAAELMAYARYREAEEAYDQARIVVEKLAADFPKESLYSDDVNHSYWKIGAARQADGRIEEAEQSFNLAVELHPKDSGVWFTRAAFFASQQNFEKAVSDYTKSLEVDPKNADTCNALAWLLATCPNVKARNPVKALKFAERSVELAPSRGDTWNTLGVAQYRAGDWKGAIKTLTKSMELRNQGDSSEYFFLALCHWQLGEKETSRKCYDKGIQWLEKNKPEDAEYGRFRAEAAEAIGSKPRRTDTPPP